MNHLDERLQIIIESTIEKASTEFTDNPKLGDIASTLKGKSRIQNDHDRFMKLCNQ